MTAEHFSGNPFERDRIFTGYSIRRALWYVECRNVRRYYSTRREALDAAKRLALPVPA
jgi:hypothetical protein